MKRRLVILVGGYYPHYGNPMGIVLDKFIDELKKDFSLTVIALQNLEAPETSRKIIHDDIEIVTASSVLHELHRKDGASRFKLLLVKFVDYLRLFFCRGVTSNDYLTDIFYSELKSQWQQKKIDAILSMSFPIQTHLAAMKFKQRHSTVKFVTYSTDTFSGSIDATRVKIGVLRNIIASRRKRAELKCYAAADHNFFSREILTSQSNFLKPVIGKCSILEYVLSDRGFTDVRQREEQDTSRINLLFAGGVGKPMRDPGYFARVYAEVAKKLNCVLHLYLLNPADKFFEDVADVPKGSVMIHHAVAPDKMRSIMNWMDVLVNLGNDSDVFSPSKLFDYVSTGLPIVSVVYRGRKRNAILDKLPFVLEIENYGDVEHDVLRLTEFCRVVKGKRLKFEEILALYPEYSSYEIAGQLVEKLMEADR